MGGGRGVGWEGGNWRKRKGREEGTLAKGLVSGEEKEGKECGWKENIRAVYEGW